MFTPIIPLLLVVSSPFCGAVPALVVHDLPLNDSADGTANITGRGVTQNPAILFLGYIVDDCYCTVDYCDFQLPDATCFPSYGASYNIQQFYGDCRFSKFTSTNHCEHLSNT